jgi:hypothetical protein
MRDAGLLDVGRHDLRAIHCLTPLFGGWPTGMLVKRGAAIKEFLVLKYNFLECSHPCHDAQAAALSL